MKPTYKGFCFLVLFTFSLVSCGFGGDTEKNAADNNDETTTESNENSEVYLEAEAWRSWAPPKEESGYSLVRFVTDPFKMQGLNSTSAHYEKGEEFITVQIIDGSSDKGRQEIRDHLEIAELERDYSSEYGYEKTLMRNGVKAKEEYLAQPAGQYLIKFMLKDQYGISVKSNAAEVATVWDFIDRLNLGNID